MKSGVHKDFKRVCYFSDKNRDNNGTADGTCGHSATDSAVEPAFDIVCRAATKPSDALPQRRDHCVAAAVSC